MRKPNFFIVGAPKCGTTTLYNWLADHPQIFMSTKKEPHFFNTDEKRLTTSTAEYESNFTNAQSGHIAVGESSVWYLYSNEAIPNILDYDTNAKLIVMLRNPVDMAYSLHNQLVFGGREQIRDFATAWDMQESRKQGQNLSSLSWEPRRLLYGEACSLGSQYERVCHRAPKKQILPIVLDDLKAQPAEQYRRVLDFLGVENDGRTEFPTLNKSKARRWPWLRRFANTTYQLRYRLGLKKGLGLLTKLDRVNVQPQPRPALNSEFQRQLQTYFEPEVLKLEQLLARDFSQWR